LLINSSTCLTVSSLMILTCWLRHSSSSFSSLVVADELLHLPHCLLADDTNLLVEALLLLLQQIDCC
jgi:hypothetical protein